MKCTNWKYIIKSATVIMLIIAIFLLPVSSAALAAYHCVAMAESHKSDNELDDVSNFGKSKKAMDYKIKVDSKKNRVYVYARNGGEWTLVGKMKCCTGKKSTPTPKGKFKTQKKKNSFVFEGKNYNYVTYFTGHYAFHSTPESNGIYSNRSLGKNESHGCVRLKPEDAQKIQSLPTGTEVEVK